MTLTPTKSQVLLIAKHPAAYMLAVVLILLGIFVSKVFSSNTERDAQCELRVKAAELRAERAELRALTADREKYQLAEQLLISANVLKSIQHATDSTVRNVVGNKAKELLKSN